MPIGTLQVGCDFQTNIISFVIPLKTDAAIRQWENGRVLVTGIQHIFQTVLQCIYCFIGIGTTLTI